MQALLAVAACAGRGVLESVWHGYAHAPLAALPGPTVEVFCRCDADVLRARFAARGARRGPGYLDHERGAAELWNPEVGTPVAAGWPVLEVDTGAAVDVAELAHRVVTAVRPRG